jgi:tripartite-type tricarboxylate transporter receptor subunit TctC
MALMAEMAGIKMVHVPYKGGGPAGTALIAGETQAMLATIGSLFPHIKSKRVRPIGVATDKRVTAVSGCAGNRRVRAGLRLHSLGRQFRSGGHAEGGG